MLEINYIAVLAAAVAAMIIGGIWYGPLFGNLWMQGQGWNPKDEAFKAQMKKKAGPAYFQMFIGALLQAFVFAHVLGAFEYVPAMAGTSAISVGLQGGFYMWLGFILPVKYGDKLWSGKAFKYVAVDLGYYLVLLLAMGVILSVW